MGPARRTPLGAAIALRYATLLLDLLTREEEAVDNATRAYRFDIERLGHRVTAAPRVQAPTLLIVGGADEEVIVLNRSAMRRMHAPVELAIVPGATHLFEEPGALEEVSRLAAEWCHKHLRQ